MRRLIYPHGFGDVVQALPSFERLARREGPLAIGVLRRLPACRDVLALAPWCSEVFDVGDPWRDYGNPDTWEGYGRGLAALLRENPGAEIVQTAPPSDWTSPLACKARRIADEFEVEWNPDRPTLHLAGYARGVAAAENLRCGLPLVAIHGTSGNPVKDVEPEALGKLAADRMGNFGAFRTVRLPIEARGEIQTVAFHAGFLSECDLFVGVDSGPAHLASIVCPRVVWVFTATPIAQAVPLWRDVEVVAAGPRADVTVEMWDAWRRANPTMVKYDVAVTKGTRDAQTRLSAR